MALAGCLATLDGTQPLGATGFAGIPALSEAGKS